MRCGTEKVIINAFRLLGVLSLICLSNPSLATPKIWFGAEPPIPLGSTSPNAGAFDYADFMTQSTGWELTAKYISVVKVNVAWIEKVASKEQIRDLVQNLKAKGVSLALEVDALQATAACKGQGFANRDRAESIKDIISAGGTVDFVVLNEPYSLGHVYSACHIEPNDLAARIKPFLDEIKAIQPNARIGIVEALLGNVSGNELVDWLDTYTRVTGSKPGFFHLDVDYKARSKDWVREFGLVAQMSHKRDVTFGAQIFGDRGDQTDREWLKKSKDRIGALQKAGINMDQIIFQSWHPRPRYLLPESKDGTFCSFILRFSKENQIVMHR